MAKFNCIALVATFVALSTFYDGADAINCYVTNQVTPTFPNCNTCQKTVVMVAGISTSTVKSCVTPGLACTQSTPNVVGNALQTGTFTYCCSTELCNTDSFGNSASSVHANLGLALLAAVAAALCVLRR